MGSILILAIVHPTTPANTVKRMWMNVLLMRTFVWMELPAQTPTETILVFALMGKFYLRNEIIWKEFKKLKMFTVT